MGFIHNVLRTLQVLCLPDILFMKANKRLIRSLRHFTVGVSFIRIFDMLFALVSLFHGICSRENFNHRVRLVAFL